MAELWRSMMTLLYWDVTYHLIPRRPLMTSSRFSEQLLKDLVSWGSHGECSTIDRFLWDAFGFFSCQFWSTVLQYGARLPIYTLNYSTVWYFLTGGVFECDIAHRRSVAVLCKLYKIRWNPTHPLNGAFPEPYVPLRVIRGARVAHRYTYTPPRCRTSQYRRTFMPLSVSLWNDLAGPVFDVVGLAGFKSRANVFFIGLSCSIPTIVFYYFSLSLLSVYRLVLWGWDLRTDRVYIALSQPCTADLFQ